MSRIVVQLIDIFILQVPNWQFLLEMLISEQTLFPEDVQILIQVFQMLLNSLFDVLFVTDIRYAVDQDIFITGVDGQSGLARGLALAEERQVLDRQSDCVLVLQDAVFYTLNVYWNTFFYSSLNCFQNSERGSEDSGFYFVYFFVFFNGRYSNSSEI